MGQSPSNMQSTIPQQQIPVNNQQQVPVQPSNCCNNCSRQIPVTQQSPPPQRSSCCLGFMNMFRPRQRNYRQRRRGIF
jgi:hypothetical protein